MRISYQLARLGVAGCFLFAIAMSPALIAAEAANPSEPIPSNSSLTPDSADYFDAQIAPLLGRHCVECHGPTKQKSRLDLSNKDAAMAGGKSGKAIVPGDLAESLLWEYVEADDMPEDAPPLSATEKQLLREWIEAGALWSANSHAPMAHVPGKDAQPRLLRRLTVPEYIETVRAALGVEIAQEARRILPRDLRADGFSNTAYNLNVDLKHVEAYSQVAEMIVQRMDVKAFAAQFAPCEELTDACMREVIAKMGKWILRGPLQEHEIDSFLRVSTALVDEGSDFTEAVSGVIETMLQAPRFIYRIEHERTGNGERPLHDYELASRLSYIIWGGPPDRTLLEAADAGKLSHRAEVAAQVERMLQDPRAVERSRQFVYEWLNLARLDNLRPNPEKFPTWNKHLAADMREETLAFFKDIAWEQNRPLADLMNAQTTYATPSLAAHYGIDDKYAAGMQTSAAAPDFGQGGSEEGLEVLYRFEEAGGELVRDLSGAGEPINLKIADPSAVSWDEGSLKIKSPTLLATDIPPTRLINALKKSNAVTLEAWITPAKLDQDGPARILTLSSGSSRRNFTLGQQNDRYDVRFRTTRRDGNGLPSLSSPSSSLELQPAHVVYTRDVTGRGKLYIDGEQVAADNIDGDHSNWDIGFTLALANETSNDRPWLGTFHHIAIYSRALDPEEIRSKGVGLLRYNLASLKSRGGFLTQGSLLTVGGDEASMVARGLFILRNFLWGSVEDPPPCVDTTPVPTEPGLSQRAISQGRLDNPSCSACHTSFEPFAFGLEKFDGLGAFHEKDEHGNRLREDGEIIFPGSVEPISFESSAQLMDLLAASERVRMGITRKAVQFALGRPLMAADASTVDQIHQKAQKGGGSYTSLITAIVMSDLVQLSSTERN